MTTETDLTSTITDYATLLDGITADQASDPTPCTDYTVGQLRDHTVGWLTAFTDGFSAADGKCSDPQAVKVEGTGGDQVRALVPRLEAAFADGAGSRPLAIGEDAMPGEMSVAMMLWEYQVHGWDLARATGQRWSPDERAVEASLEFAPMMLTDDYQGEGKTFAPRVPVPDDAPALDRLVGMSGRDPQWTP